MASAQALDSSLIRAYNTLTKRKEVLRPGTDNSLHIFVCGPTVYDYPHLGHAKTYTQFDFIVRYLRARGFTVTYVQNITDIDDKIIQKANERGVRWSELAREYEEIYKQDMAALHNTAVDRYIRATDHIEAIISQVQRLLDRGFAYESSDGIYYEIARFPDYGRLSGRRELQKNDAVSRIDDGVEKRGFGDFCLWKYSKPQEPSWPSPFGPGRPGWHIEDTAITETVFGPQYDIHGGAIDLIFPHHEAEIAQMEAISQKPPLVRYWFHTGFLNILNEKMSKSARNFRTIRQALDAYDYRTLRYFFLSSHYRSSIDYSEDSLRAASGALARLDDFVSRIDLVLDDRGDEGAVEDARREIFAALDDDFNTPRALAVLFDFVRAQNRKGPSGARSGRLLQELDEFWGFFAFEQETLSATVRQLIAERDLLRKAGDYQKADAIRDRLLRDGIHLYDTENGVRWRLQAPAGSGEEAS